MPGVAAKALLVAALLAAPGAVVRPASPAPAPVNAPPQVQPVSLRALGEQAFAANSDGFLFHGPERPRLVERWWTELRGWTAAQFERLGPVAARRLPAEAHGLSADLDMAAVPLASDLFLISASRYGHGNAFIIGRRDGHFRILWTIDAPDPTARRAFPLLAGWSSDGGGCDEGPCWPISIEAAGVLPPGPHGEARFYLQGTYFSEMGFTKAGHLAIWEWDGHRARPLLARHFTFMIAQEAPVLTVRGGDLLLHVKGELSHFYACGQCEGRQMAWRLRMEPGGVRDLGQTSLTPELDFMDQLAGRLLRNEPVADVADAAPAAFFKRQVVEAAGGDELVGMLGHWQATRAGNRTRLCFTADGVTGLFTLVGQGEQLRLVGARPIATNACDRPGAHM